MLFPWLPAFNEKALGLVYNARARLSLRMRTQRVRVYARFLWHQTHTRLVNARERTKDTLDGPRGRKCRDS